MTTSKCPAVTWELLAVVVGKTAAMEAKSTADATTFREQLDTALLGGDVPRKIRETMGNHRKTIGKP